MAKRQVLGEFVFSRAAWSAAIQEAMTILEGDAQAFFGVSRTCLWAWSQGRYAEGFQYPSMTNFLKVCDLLHLNPQEFFVMEEV